MHISTEEVNLKGYKAIIPAVSTGNVGQLAVDLLIATVEANKIGSIWHEGVLPLVGSDAFDTTSLNLTMSTEIFASESNKCVFIQIRSPILKHLEDNFKDSVANWMVSVGIEQLIILGSALDIKKYKSQMDDPESIRFAYGPTADPLAIEQLKAFECREFDDGELEDLKEEQGLRLALNLMNHCEVAELPCIFLLKYSDDGDTQTQATSVACLIDNLYEMLPQNMSGEKHFTVPPSWDLLFGNDSPENLY